MTTAKAMNEQTPGQAVPKIYIFVCGHWGEDYSMLAVAEDGEEVANHISSTPDFGKYDMGLNGGTWKHDRYAKKYPKGYELEWVDDWKTHPFLSAQAQRNREQPDGRPL